VTTLGEVFDALDEEVAELLGDVAGRPNRRRENGPATRPL